MKLPKSGRTGRVHFERKVIRAKKKVLEKIPAKIFTNKQKTKKDRKSVGYAMDNRINIISYHIAMAVSPRSRSEKSPDFLKTYKFMCDQNDAGPLKRVMRHAQDRIVDINVDNIRPQNCGLFYSFFYLNFPSLAKIKQKVTQTDVFYALLDELEDFFPGKKIFYLILPIKISQKCWKATDEDVGLAYCPNWIMIKSEVEEILLSMKSYPGGIFYP
ncbi:hypothetical protein EGR_09658 [Echinococcus granulosus]|uniref:Uncharacterized protein n=1 Tax=Echinococcus granulosus TaxID=6210 RepID=W6UQ54_ECHGR|nr:hypothetical protein EGR_09658 [Echinococcus granulosus]EUB55484.1 hypothetical protein EGR_09658 [Echinococcus granulosus]